MIVRKQTGEQRTSTMRMRMTLVQMRRWRRMLLGRVLCLNLSSLYMCYPCILSSLQKDKLRQIYACTHTHTHAHTHTLHTHTLHTHMHIHTQTQQNAKNNVRIFLHDTKCNHIEYVTSLSHPSLIQHSNFPTNTSETLLLFVPCIFHVSYVYIVCFLL